MQPAGSARSGLFLHLGAGGGKHRESSKIKNAFAGAKVLSFYAGLLPSAGAWRHVQDHAQPARESELPQSSSSLWGWARPGLAMVAPPQEAETDCCGDGQLLEQWGKCPREGPGQPLLHPAPDDGACRSTAVIEYNKQATWWGRRGIRAGRTL